MYNLRLVIVRFNNKMALSYKRPSLLSVVGYIFTFAGFQVISLSVAITTYTSQGASEVQRNGESRQSSPIPEQPNATLVEEHHHAKTAVVDYDGGGCIGEVDL